MEKQNEYWVSERFKNRLDEREGMPKAPNSDSVGDCPKGGKEGPCSVSDDQVCMSQDQEIQIQWQHIETSLAILRNMHIGRANMEFWGRFEMVMKGMR